MLLWLFPMLFLLASLPMVSPIATVDPPLVWWNVVCAFACAGLVAAAGRKPARTFWVWVIFAVFIMGYFAKVIIYTKTYQRTDFDLWSDELAWLTLRDVMASYRVMCIAFVLFCAVSIALLRWNATRGRPTQLPERPDVSRRWIVLVLSVTLGLTIAAALLPPLLGFGLMGGDTKTLPFRSDIIITRFRLDIGPAVLLWVVWVADQQRFRKLWLSALIAMVVLALADAIARASRGSLLMVLLPVLMLWLITDRFTRRRKMFGAGILVLVVLLYPVFGVQRAFRAQNSIGAIRAVQMALRSGPGEQWVEVVLFKVGTRISGAEGLWHVTRYFSESHASQPWQRELTHRFQLLLHQSSMATFHTHEVAGVIDPREGRSPGLLAALAEVMGSITGLFFALPVYLAIAWLIWNWASRLRIAPVALAFYANLLLFYTSEGGLGVQDPIAFFISIGVVALIQRLVERASDVVPPLQPEVTVDGLQILPA